MASLLTLLFILSAGGPASHPLQGGGHGGGPPLASLLTLLFILLREDQPHILSKVEAMVEDLHWPLC